MVIKYISNKNLSGEYKNGKIIINKFLAENLLPGIKKIKLLNQNSKGKKIKFPPRNIRVKL